MLIIDNLTLEKPLGKGSFGQVYLSKLKNDNNIYATKVYDREKLEGTEAMKYLTDEINILHDLHHPNIVNFVQVKKTKKHYYIVMEYCNGGELEKALDNYQLKYGKPFSEEIVQHLMRQIIDAFKYIHGNKVMHRDIKLENILLNFKNPQDKEDLNMMNATVKIIDFGFARRIDKNALAYTTIGNPMNMDPLLLKKLTSQGKIRQLGYDQKADIWSLGAICYQMLIGKCAFDAEDMDELVDKIEKGKYKVPTNLSREVVSFLNGMLQYESKQRLSCEELSNHQFLKNNVKDFHKMDLTQVSDKVKNGELVMETKKDKNRTIWSVFNESDKLLKISPGHLATIPENSEQGPIKHQNTLDPGNNNNTNNSFSDTPGIKSTNTFQMNSHPYINNYNNYNSNYNHQYYGPILPRGNQGIPGNPFEQNKGNPQNFKPPNNSIPKNSNTPNYQNPQNYSNSASFSSQPMIEIPYSFRGSIYGK